MLRATALDAAALTVAVAA